MPPTSGQIARFGQRIGGFLAGEQSRQFRKIELGRAAGGDQKHARRRVEGQDASHSPGVIFAKGLRLIGGGKLVGLVQAEQEIFRIVPRRHLGQKILRLNVGVFFDALNPDGEEHVTQHSPREIHVRGEPAVDVGQVEQHLATEMRLIVRNDSEFSRSRGVAGVARPRLAASGGHRR